MRSVLIMYNNQMKQMKHICKCKYLNKLGPYG